MTAAALAPAALGLLFLLALCLVFQKPLAKLCKLLGKTAVGLAALAVLKPVGAVVGLTLGVNLLNALTLALLGVPGLGLLMLLNWVTRL